MSFPATVAEFKAQFDRDFIFGTGKETVRDQDVELGQGNASMLFNTDLWESGEVKIAFNWATAHFVALAIQAAGGLSPTPTGRGVQNRGGGVTQSKTVAQVTINYAVNEKFQNDPILSQFLRTDYGQIYLNLVSGRLVGNVFVAPGFNDTGGPTGGV